jgi:hypothetical protein
LSIRDYRLIRMKGLYRRQISRARFAGFLQAVRCPGFCERFVCLALHSQDPLTGALALGEHSSASKRSDERDAGALTEN